MKHIIHQTTYHSSSLCSNWESKRTFWSFSAYLSSVQIFMCNIFELNNSHNLVRRYVRINDCIFWKCCDSSDQITSISSRLHILLGFPFRGGWKLTLRWPISMIKHCRKAFSVVAVVPGKLLKKFKWLTMLLLLYYIWLQSLGGTVSKGVVRKISYLQ